MNKPRTGTADRRGMTVLRWGADETRPDGMGTSALTERS